MSPTSTWARRRVPGSSCRSSRGPFVLFGAAYGGTLVFEYGFNVENVEEVWKESEEDHVRLPRGGSSSSPGSMAADRPLGYVTQTSALSSAPPQVVYETISDLRNHLDWLGQRASSQTFELLSIEAPEGPASVGTAFTSSGAADNGTFHDRSEVTVAIPPSSFVIETDARLDRKRGKPRTRTSSTATTWRPRARARGITYTETIESANYVPYWLQPGVLIDLLVSTSTVRTGSSLRISRGSPRSVRAGT